MIQGAIESAQAKNLQNNIAAASEELKGTKLQGNKTAETLLGISNSAADNGTSADNEFLSALDTTTSNIGIGLFRLDS